MHCAHRPRPRAGFTLIEMLVVVAVIAILISVLLPALGRARQQARVTLTLARLRDIGMSMSVYANDFSEARPVLLGLGEDEKAFLGLGVLAQWNEVPPEAFVNPNTTDEPASVFTDDRRPILAQLAGQEITNATPIDPGNIIDVAFHCSFAYDDDPKSGRARQRLRVYMGDRADYATGRTVSANWEGRGQALLWTDQHAEFRESRALPAQHDPNIYHHNELGGEGADELVDGVAVSEATIDTHLRFFSEEEDDELLPD